MDVISLVTGAIALLLFLWAGAIIMMWAFRPFASPALFVRALACVGIAIVCALAGMTTLNGDVHFRVSQIVYLIVGIGAIAAGAHQSQRLFTDRYVDLGRRDAARRKRR